MINFIRIDPVDNDILWAGGQKANGSSLLLKSINQGIDWQRIHIFRNDTIVTNSCRNIVIHPELQNKAWVSLRSIVKETSTYGVSWITKLAGSPDYILDYIAIDSINPDNLYVISRAATGNFLNLFKSNDSGNNWTSISDINYNYHMVHDMIVMKSGNTNYIYLATENGILKYIDN